MRPVFLSRQLTQLGSEHQFCLDCSRGARAMRKLGVDSNLFCFSKPLSCCFASVLGLHYSEDGLRHQCQVAFYSLCYSGLQSVRHGRWVFIWNSGDLFFLDHSSFGFPHLSCPQGSFLPFPPARKMGLLLDLQLPAPLLCSASASWGLYLGASRVRKEKTGSSTRSSVPGDPFPHPSVQKERFLSELYPAMLLVQWLPDLDPLWGHRRIKKTGEKNGKRPLISFLRPRPTRSPPPPPSPPTSQRPQPVASVFGPGFQLQSAGERVCSGCSPSWPCFLCCFTSGQLEGFLLSFLFFACLFLILKKYTYKIVEFQ